MGSRRPLLNWILWGLPKLLREAAWLWAAACAWARALEGLVCEHPNACSRARSLTTSSSSCCAKACSWASSLTTSMSFCFASAKRSCKAPSSSSAAAAARCSFDEGDLEGEAEAPELRRAPRLERSRRKDCTSSFSVSGASSALLPLIFTFCTVLWHRTILARAANCSVDNVSEADAAEGETCAVMEVLEFPPKESRINKVNLLSRKFT
mmetsp:Transcript_40594/g.130599  ORF Transcript_40594/g.130599 Transcript_40594/m.130599 type:complete len:209 (-) Transcript_40594:1370-1996(-)